MERRKQRVLSYVKEDWDSSEKVKLRKKAGIPHVNTAPQAVVLSCWELSCTPLKHALASVLWQNNMDQWRWGFVQRPQAQFYKLSSH